METNDRQKVINFIIWLYLHDKDAKYVLYMPFSENHYYGGLIISLNGSIDKDFISFYATLKEQLNFSLRVDYISRELNLDKASSNQAININFITEVSLLIKQTVASKFDEISEYHRNFLIPEQRKKLIDLEKELIFHPLIAEMALMKNVSWFSAFGWHSVNKELYRIDYDVINDLGESIINWDALDKKTNQFHFFAEGFDKFVGEKDLISLGEILFTQAKNKRPIIISFIKDEGSEIVTKDDNFIYFQFSKFYSQIENKLKKYISNLDFKSENNESNGFTMDALRNAIIEEGGHVVVLQDMQDAFIEGFKKLAVNMPDEADFAKKLFVYLCWLAIHDLDAKIIAYFPSSVIPDLPSGGFMIGFKLRPTVSNLLNIQEFVNNFFVLKSYFLSELVPEFPNVLNQDSFRRQTSRHLRRPLGSVHSYVFIDMDKLSKFNDEYKHHGGTFALKILVASIIKACDDNKISDYFMGKWGGDEFVLLLDVEKEVAKKILVCARINLKNDDLFNDELASLRQIGIIKSDMFTSLKNNKDDIQKRLSFSAGLVSFMDTDVSSFEVDCDNILMTFKNKGIRGYVATDDDLLSQDEFVKKHINYVKESGNEYLIKYNKAVSI